MEKKNCAVAALCGFWLIRICSFLLKFQAHFLEEFWQKKAGSHFFNLLTPTWKSSLSPQKLLSENYVNVQPNFATILRVRNFWGHISQRRKNHSDFRFSSFFTFSVVFFATVLNNLVVPPPTVLLHTSAHGIYTADSDGSV